MTRRIRYADVASTLALVVALGGTSYAAVTLSADSVGARELKDGSVTTREVRNGTLQRADFASGTLLKGDRGPAGAAGPTGPTGPVGPVGPAPCTDGLLCPDAVLPGGGYARIMVDDFLVAQVPAYRVTCTTAGGCEIGIGGPLTADTTLDSWYDAAAQNNVAAAKTFTLTEFTGAGVPVRRYEVGDGLPKELVQQDNRFRMTFATGYVYRSAG